MTRLCYLLPFLWALVYGSTVQSNTATPTKGPTLDITTAVAAKDPAQDTTTTVKSVITYTSPHQFSSTMSNSISTTNAESAPETTTLFTTKPSSPESSGHQEGTQQTTVKDDTKSDVVTSSSKSSIKVTTPTPATRQDNVTNSTDPTKDSLPRFNDSLVVTSPSSTITNKSQQLTTQLPESSSAFLTSSGPSNDTEVLMSTVSISPVTTSGTTRGNITDSNTSLSGNTMPTTSLMITSTMISKQKNIENIEVNCTEEYSASFVTINMKSSSICGDYSSKPEDEVKEILKQICTALKPGYQPDKDKCHIDFGSGHPDQLVIVDAYVQSSLPPTDLYASLKHIKKAQDGSYLFTYDGKKYEEEDLVSIPLISAIVALAVALLIAAAIYGCWHQRQTRKREQRLTEELQTVENGYHDNPTLEVMETSPEMQEKKGGPNGELGDSWIVPLDNLTREDFDEEEDTHL